MATSSLSTVARFPWGSKSVLDGVNISDPPMRLQLFEFGNFYSSLLYYTQMSSLLCATSIERKASIVCFEHVVGFMVFVFNPYECVRIHDNFDNSSNTVR